MDQNAASYEKLQSKSSPEICSLLSVARPLINSTDWLYDEYAKRANSVYDEAIFPRWRNAEPEKFKLMVNDRARDQVLIQLKQRAGQAFERALVMQAFRIVVNYETKARGCPSTPQTEMRIARRDEDSTNLPDMADSQLHAFPQEWADHGWSEGFARAMDVAYWSHYPGYTSVFARAKF